jgi:hypothetical protein
VAQVADDQVVAGAEDVADVNDLGRKLSTYDYPSYPDKYVQPCCRGSQTSSTMSLCVMCRGSSEQY